MDFRGIREFLKDSFGYIIVIVVVLFVGAYVVTLQQNVGPSMAPTLNENDVFLLNKTAYKVRKVKRNDIIAFLYSDTKYLVKRVIGLPGEKIEFKNNILYIDDKPYEEKFLDDNMETWDFSTATIKGCENGIIPENSYLVLGDNRVNSLDSRKIGVIKKEDIIGKTSFRIWPLSDLGIIK